MADLKQAVKNLLRGGGIASVLPSSRRSSSEDESTATRAMQDPGHAHRRTQNMPGMNGLGEYGPYGALFPQSPVTKVTASPRQAIEPTFSPRLAPNFPLVSPSLDGLGAAPYGGGSESGPLFPVPSITRVVPTPERRERAPVPPQVVPLPYNRLGVLKTAVAARAPTLYAPNAFPETSPPLDGCGCGGFGAFVAEPGQAASMDRNALHGLGAVAAMLRQRDAEAEATDKAQAIAEAQADAETQANAEAQADVEHMSFAKFMERLSRVRDKIAFKAKTLKRMSRIRKAKFEANKAHYIQTLYRLEQYFSYGHRVDHDGRPVRGSRLGRAGRHPVAGFGAFVAEPGQAASMDRNALHGLGEDSGGGNAGKMIVGLAVLGGLLYFAAGGLGHKGGARAR